MESIGDETAGQQHPVDLLFVKSPQNWSADVKTAFETQA